EHKPSDSQIKEFVDTPLLNDLDNHLQQTYKVQPKLFYSNCSMDKGMWKGWNVKYKKSGKSLCTIYPKQGYFLLLMPIGLREMNAAELLTSLCTDNYSDYTKNLFEQAVVGHFGKMLAFDVTSEDILHDVKNLIAIRVKLMMAK
ncbi:MAG: DUF3788 domain-containing protein, partial [Chitinispirillia bacterium]|nr:DUF3788 domain-containing protein [Chitinispirillia bacterium]